MSENRKFFREIQAELFTLGSHLATKDPKMREKLPKLSEHAIKKFEDWMDAAAEKIPVLKNFLLPGGHPAVADAHIARAVCRRAERRCVGLSREEDVNPELIKYLNRLSDLLFTTARLLSYLTETEEIAWKTCDL
jgi:cob(I)alamin adenosyltransferase